jgi:hypothetical protein
VIKISQDAAAGIILSAIGAIAAIMSSHYSLGTAENMGPGYFPLIVSGLLVLVGVSLLLRGRYSSESAVTALRWRSTVMVVASIVLFALTVNRLGSFVAVLLTLLCASAGSARFRFGLASVLGAVAFSAVCAVTFSVLLGLPMPLVGTWLRPLLHM